MRESRSLAVAPKGVVHRSLTSKREDLEVTRQMVRSGELLGIRVRDHVVIGDGRYVSLMERGLLDGEAGG